MMASGERWRPKTIRTQLGVLAMICCLVAPTPVLGRPGTQGKPSLEETVEWIILQLHRYTNQGAVEVIDSKVYELHRDLTWEDTELLRRLPGPRGCVLSFDNRRFLDLSTLTYDRFDVARIIHKP